MAKRRPSNDPKSDSSPSDRELLDDMHKQSQCSGGWMMRRTGMNSLRILFNETRKIGFRGRSGLLLRVRGMIFAVKLDGVVVPQLTACPAERSTCHSLLCKQSSFSLRRDVLNAACSRGRINAIARDLYLAISPLFSFKDPGQDIGCRIRLDENEGIGAERMKMIARPFALSYMSCSICHLQSRRNGPDCNVYKLLNLPIAAKFQTIAPVYLCTSKEEAGQTLMEM